MRALDDCTTTVELLLKAERPAILLGPEARLAVPLLLELAGWLGAPLGTTPDALALIDGERSCGVFSFGASAHAKRTLEQADLVLAVSDLGEFTCRLGEAFARQTLIQVAESTACWGRRREPDVALLGPLTANLARLIESLRAQLRAPRRAWFEPLPTRADLPPSSGTKRVDAMLPEEAARAIEASLPKDVRVCLDVTSGALHCYENWRLAATQRVFSSIERSACMGEALLASLGIRLASGLPTLTIVGDWGHCMTPAELHTAVELAVDRYVIVVWSNGGGAFIRAGASQQRLQVPDELWRWRQPPKFAEVALGYGADAVVVTDAASLQRAVTAGLFGARPLLIEARIDPAALVPAGDRFLTLGESEASNAQHASPES